MYTLPLVTFLHPMLVDFHFTLITNSILIIMIPYKVADHTEFSSLFIELRQIQVRPKLNHVFRILCSFLIALSRGIS